MPTRDQQVSIECTAGRELSYTFTVTDKNGTVIDISNMTPRFAAHTPVGKVLGTAPLLHIYGSNFAVTDGPNGECTLTIPGSLTEPLATMTLEWEAIIDDLSGDDAEIGHGIMWINASLFAGT